MSPFDLTPVQERWTIGGLLAIVLVVGAMYFSASEEGAPPTRWVTARQIKPGGYVLSKVSWGATDRTILRGKKPPPARSEGEDGVPPVEANGGPGEMPAIFKELQGIPISVGGR